MQIDSNAYDSGTGRMRHIAFVFWVVIAALGPASEAIALPAGYEITPVSASRGIYAFGASYCPGCGIDGEDENYSNSDNDDTRTLGEWSSSVQSLGSDAWQHTYASADRLGGTIGIGLGGSGDNNASTRFEAFFTVGQQKMYALEGDMSGYVEFEVIRLLAGDDVVFEGPFGQGPFRGAFMLEPGTTYHLYAEVAGADYGGTSNGATMSFALVPEPTTAVLLGLGLALAGIGARRHRSG